MSHLHDHTKQEVVHYFTDMDVEEITPGGAATGQIPRKGLFYQMLERKFQIIGCIIVGLFLFKLWSNFTQYEQAKEAQNRETAKLYQYQLSYLSAKSLHKEIVLKWKIEQLEAEINNKNKSRELASIELDFLKLDANNKGIADVLYKDEATRKLRQEFYNERVRYADLNSNVTSLFLTKYNLILDKETMEQGTKVNQEEWVRLEKKFKLSEFTEELPMCIIVPGYNNNDQFRIESNLNSIFAQNYTNYKVVIVNDASTDGSGEVYGKYLDFYNIDRSRYVYIENQKKVTALLNIYLAVMHHCSMDSIAVTVDADDELVGRNALQVFNWGYQKLKSGVLYSSYIWYHQSVQVFEGQTSQYTEQEKKNRYRDSFMKFSQLRSFRTELLHQASPESFKDSQGVFYMSTYDMALFYPLMQLSCGRVDKIEGEFHYLYNTGTGINDFSVDHALQIRTDGIIRGAKRLDCYEQFNERMNRS